MRVKICKNQNEAMKYAYGFLMKGRHVRTHKLPNGKYEVRVLARGQK